MIMTVTLSRGALRMAAKSAVIRQRSGRSATNSSGTTTLHDADL
jgi:hypothetical protein